MKFVTIQIPVMVSGCGTHGTAVAAFTVMTHDEAGAQEAVNVLVSKLSDAAKLIDLGDEE